MEEADGDTKRRDDSKRVNRALAVAAVVAAILVFVASLMQGAPKSLPGIALSWPLILYLERAGFVALLIVGIGGVLYRLLTGGQVQAVGAPGAPTVGVEDVTKPTETLKEGVDADVKAINERLTEVEKRVETDESGG